ncbi:tRNA pseudouridine(55) synthase TruB [Neogemmobacter tilapiae]|uniref:tRNA pseudouridine synthase B n=1 Tax=Neogemmobacter tilapiae TaxID=875041 RepID=A0A918WL76_9RHOB|nr:tRNA pseudouridine(55) synthase TruB [Gemmobacter tilapiae]GHC56556.1 tRNA pseudouridine synthase B [Gemmobacter tilapiae]
MARGKKGRPVNGWLVIDKPAGVGSTPLVAKVRWLLQAQKAGHAGTLDPAATGVLAIALGEATKTVPYVTDASKGYRFLVRWGASTTTDDAEGAIVETRDLRPTREQIESALPAFRGLIRQVPPQVSAVRVDGERAYDLAREGVEMELAARDLLVERLVLVEAPDADTALFEMDCGKGGYVRSIARDLGQALGCLGHVVWLRREWSGPFDAADGLAPTTLDDLTTETLEAALLPVSIALEGIPRVEATESGQVRLKNGNAGQVISPPGLQWGELVQVWRGDDLLALGRYQGGEVAPERVFNL